jgi:hypothetical protein
MGTTPEVIMEKYRAKPMHLCCDLCEAGCGCAECVTARNVSGTKRRRGAVACTQPEAKRPKADIQ